METLEKKQSTGNLSVLKKLPNLHEAEASQRELSSTYWTPEKEGEYKVGIILDVKEEPYQDEKTGETVMLDCVTFLAQETDGSFSTMRNGSKRLVATIASALESGEITLEQTPIKITFSGKQKNKTNGYMSDRWSVKPLILS